MIRGVRGVLVTSHFPLPARAGGQKRTLRLLEAMERAGARVHIITTDAELDDEGAAAARARGWEVDRLARPVPSATAKVRQHLRRDHVPPVPELAGRLHALRDDLAWVQLEEIGVAQHVRHVPADARCVVSLHNVDSEVYGAMARAEDALVSRARTRWAAARMAATERRAAERADLLVTVSEHDQRHFARFARHPPILVPNGVDAQLLEVPAALPADPVALFFGQFRWPPNRQGLERFVAEAWPRVREAVPGARLRVAGPGTEMLEVPSGAAGVEVVGFVDDLAAELAGTRVVVVPIWVGGGTRIKVLEAMAAARPVVGTPLGVERLGFTHAVHGLLADDPAGLAAHVVAVMTDDGLAAALAARARELARGYVWEEVVRPLERRYEAWTKASRTSASRTTATAR